MVLDIPDRYLVARLRRRPDGTLRLTLAGGAAKAGAGSVEGLAGDTYALDALLPAGNDAAGATAAVAVRALAALHGYGVPPMRPSRTPVRLPVFVDPPPGEPALLALLADWLRDRAGLDPALHPVVLLAASPWEPRAPVVLPLVVTAVGPEAALALDLLHQEPWLSSSPVTRRFGLMIQEVGDPAAIAELEGADVIVIGAARAGVLAVPASARLVVVLEPQAPAGSPPLVTSPGTALLRLFGPNPPAAMLELLLGVVHDLPLHEAAALAAERGGGSAQLTATPASNLGVRLSDAYADAVGRAFELEIELDPGDVKRLVGRVGTLVSAPAATRLLGLDRLAEPIRRAAGAMAAMPIDFGRETRGLGPLADAQSALAGADLAGAELRENLALLGDDPEVRAAIEQTTERRADARLRRVEHSARLAGYVAAEEALWVGADTSLRAGAAYVLELQIGQRLRGTLVAGEPPPIDPLLPGSEVGHELEVALFPLDFTADGPRVQKLLLPRLGPSPLLAFPVQAPERPGPARLRFGIYHRDHLIQSFLLRARVDAEEAYAHGDDRLVIALEFSQTSRFANVDELGPRALALGVNDDPRSGAHTFTFKRGAESCSIDLAATALKGPVDAYRAVLLRATANEREQPRFPTERQPGAPAPEAFPEVVRALADLGRGLFKAVLDRAGDALEEALRALRTTEDECLQVARFDATYAFPWAIVYDFQLPEPVEGVVAPVCPGWVGADGAEIAGDTPGARECGHGPASKRYCVRGFWGFRHRIEELVDAPGDPVRTLEASRRPGAIRVANGSAHASAIALAGDLQGELAPPGLVAELGASEDLLDVLWDPASRPAALIVLGHFETLPVTGTERDPRITLTPPPRALRDMAITDRRASDGRWRDHRPLVLLMACSSSAVDASTLNGFLLSLTGVGAAAIVGTECPVFETLVARFAREVTADLWTIPGATLGGALLRFRRRLMAEQNPLGFVFTAVGPVDLSAGAS